MDFGVGTYALALVAGILTTLSPCVLPLLPILLGAALAAHRCGPLALAGGLAFSFTVVGIFVIGLGAALGFDPGWVRAGAAGLLIVFGALLVSPFLQRRFARASTGLSNLGGAGGGLLAQPARFAPEGWRGQFVLGAVLGLAWSPCVGPTLGAAVTLASQGRDLPQIALLLAVFGSGAGLPLIGLGLASRAMLVRHRAWLLAAGRLGRQWFGVVLLVLGALILTGADKRFEAWVLQTAPQWLVDLTTAV